MSPNRVFRNLVVSPTLLFCLLLTVNSRAGAVDHPPGPGMVPVAQEEEGITVRFHGSPGNLAGGVAQFLRHYSVVWIEDAWGQYVTTLQRFGDWYWYDLRQWHEAADYDGVSAATPALPAPACTVVGPSCWAPETATGSVTRIPDGTYQIVIETSDLELPVIGATHVFRIPWIKNGTAQTLSPAAGQGFTSVSVDYTGRTPGSDYAPAVLAGNDRWIMLPAALGLEGVLFDDEGVVTGAWEQVSGPAGGTATFSDPADPRTTVTFDAAGRWVLRLTADDGTLTAFDEVTIWVNAVVVHPVADTVVGSAYPTFNYGGARNININDTQIGYYRFDLTGITGTPQAAVLRLATVEGGFATTPREFRRVADDTWDELAMTWNNRPAPDPAVVASALPGGGWAEFDLGAAVIAEHAGDGVLSLQVRSASTPGAWSIFATKDRQPTEMGQHYAPPSLVIFLAPPDTQTLGVSFSPSSAYEGAGTLTGAGTVVATPAPTTDLVIDLASADPGELIVPATVTITAGTTSATFDVSPVDDGLTDGNQPVTVTATTAGYDPGAAVFTVLDDTDPVEDAGPDADSGGDAGPDGSPDGTDDPTGDSGGCSCQAGTAPASGTHPAGLPALLLLLLATALVFRRRN
ncbi:DNRLRE domain-containing protein [Myxococcota bacterium]|nr:DNRLRE domain-containing protein [Myxococcota bacterium]